MNDVKNVELYLKKMVFGLQYLVEARILVLALLPQLSTGFTVAKDTTVRLLIVADVPSTAVAGHIFSLGFESGASQLMMKRKHI